MPTKLTKTGRRLLATGRQLEGSPRLEQVASVIRPLIDGAMPTAGPVRDVLRGSWLGHGLHPMLTDFPLGAWTSATLLDLFGGRRAAPYAQALTGFGVAMAVPTAMAGAADWAAADSRSQRVGVAHAAANTAALTCYALSLTARPRHRGSGTALAVLGGLFAIGGGWLGGHLSLVRNEGAGPLVGKEGGGPSGANEGGGPLAAGSS